MTNCQTRGFTLIELMVTLVIVGILSAIAYPSYVKWMTATRRSDAETVLTQLANQEEKYFTQCNTYTKNLNGGTGDCSSSGGLGYQVSGLSPDSHYLVSILPPTSNCLLPSCYVIQADPNGAGTTGRQSNDGKFQIKSTGQKLWDKQNNGTFCCAWTSN